MGLGQRGYARHRKALGLPGSSHTAVKNAIDAGRITLEPDGTIDPEKADREWAGKTDPSKQRESPAATSVRQTLTESGVPAPRDIDFRNAKTAHEVAKAHMARLRVQRMRGELVSKAKAVVTVFDLAKRDRDAWLGWPARVAAQMAAELDIDAHALNSVLDRYVRKQLSELADVKPDFG